MERITKELLNNKEELEAKIKKDLKENWDNENYTTDKSFIDPISDFLDSLSFQEILDIAKNYTNGTEELRYLLFPNEYNLKDAIIQFIINKIVEISEDIEREIEESKELEDLDDEEEDEEGEDENL